jgi:hypothetical protein
VSARGACFGTKNLPLVASILYLSAWDIVSYLLEICLPLDEMNVKVKSKSHQSEFDSEIEVKSQ